MTRAVIISNPNASRSDAGKLGQAIERLRAGGLTVDVAATREAGHGEELARAALDDGAELLIAHGGDGTIMEIAPVIAGTGRPIGLLPAGTGNRLADNLHIPWGPVAAAETILAMRPRAIDIGRLEAPDVSRYFAVAGGCGYDAEVMFQTTTSAKRTWGSGAYFGTAIRLAFAMPRAQVRVEVDGVAVEREAVMVLLANCGTILPIGHRFGAHIREDDGQLDVIILNTRTFVGATRIAWALALGDSSRHPGIEFLRGRVVKIRSEPGMAAQADGELCGRTPLTAELLVGGLTVLAPRAR